MTTDTETAQPQESCATCIFAMLTHEQKLDGDPSGRVVRVGFCRRYPPTMIAALSPVERPSKMVGGAPQIVGMQTVIQPSFATTHSEQWCGEYDDGVDTDA